MSCWPASSSRSSPCGGEIRSPRNDCPPARWEGAKNGTTCPACCAAAFCVAAGVRGGDRGVSALRGRGADPRVRGRAPGGAADPRSPGAARSGGTGRAVVGRGGAGVRRGGGEPARVSGRAARPWRGRCVPRAGERLAGFPVVPHRRIAYHCYRDTVAPEATAERVDAGPSGIALREPAGRARGVPGPSSRRR